MVSCPASLPGTPCFFQEPPAHSPTHLIDTRPSKPLYNPSVRCVLLTVLAHTNNHNHTNNMHSFASDSLQCPQYRPLQTPFRQRGNERLLYSSAFPHAHAHMQGRVMSESSRQLGRPIEGRQEAQLCMPLCVGAQTCKLNYSAVSSGATAPGRSISCDTLGCRPGPLTSRDGSPM